MITDATIQKLHNLLLGETLPYSTLSEFLREELISEQLLGVQVNGSRRKLYVLNKKALLTYLTQRYEELRGLGVENNLNLHTRAAQAEYSGNSKIKLVRSCPGFLVNTYHPVSALIGNIPITINPPVGTMFFISDWQRFHIAEDVVVIGVENMENFRKIEQQKYLFESLGSPILFVSRYPQSLDLRNWLIHIPNRYIHFGDFDLAGIHIYETEYKSFLGGRASFFIPNDIELRLAYGSSKRYNDQIKHFRNYTPQDLDVLPLFQLIHHYHRAYDQEGYIINNRI